MNKKRPMCKNPACNKLLFRTTDKYCSYACAKVCDDIPKPINKQSKKRIPLDREYLKKRKEFLARPENQICFVDGCEKKANSVEHLKGRVGDNYLNTEYWQPCCIFHNLEFERNPELSKKYQLSRFHKGEKIEK